MTEITIKIPATTNEEQAAQPTGNSIAVPTTLQTSEGKCYY